MRRTTAIANDEVSVKRSRSGLGLFAKTPLRPGRYIEYVGPLITNEEADKKPKARYLFEVNSRWTIDGSVRTNIARYINHSCTPNCEAEQSGKRIYIKVIQTIKTGEELTYDYGTEYFNDFIRPHGCRCTHCTKVPKQS